MKLDMLHQHTSQVFEWLPYNQGRLQEVPAGDTERRRWLRQTYAPRFAAIADQYRGLLIDLYGPERGARVQHAEAFEVCEYGASLTHEARLRLFPSCPEPSYINP